MHFANLHERNFIFMVSTFIVPHKFIEPKKNTKNPLKLQNKVKKYAS